MTPQDRHASSAIPAIALFVLAALIYAASTYGGIRSPDSEIVYRTAEALAERGEFAIQDTLSLWEGFGTPVGRDGRRYSLFGPGQSVAAALVLRPLLALGATDRLGERRPPVSHYAGDGLTHFLDHTSPPSREPHDRRFLISFFNVGVTALLALVYFLWMRRLLDCAPAAVWITIILSFATPFFPYAGTFFSEPLATLLLVASIALIVPAPADSGGALSGGWRCLASGACLGGATATHLSALLFVPFWMAFIIWKSIGREGVQGRVSLRSAAWLAGFGVFMLLLAWHNAHRFGSVFETGRTVDSPLGYGAFMAPWAGLSGLLWSSGKGLLWYCPAVLLGLLSWKCLFARDRALAVLLLAAAAFRVVFIAARSDWHGGFSLGPRYLLMLIPLLLVPAGFWLKELHLRRRRLALLAVACFVFLCIAQQLYFSLGEIFSFFHIIRIAGAEKGLNVFQDYYIYRDWGVSPLFYLLDAHRAPWTLRSLPWSNYTLWLLGWVPAGLGVAGLYLGSLGWMRSEARRDAAAPDAR